MGYIPRGIPNVLMGQENRVQQISPSVIPPTEPAVQMYKDNVGRLTDPAPFGVDPLANNYGKKCICEASFTVKYPSYICRHFSPTCEWDIATPFKHALLFYIDITKCQTSSYNYRNF